MRDTRRLSAFLTDRYRLDADDLLIGFSGSKGFHVELPVGWMVEASPDANLTCRRFAEHAANEVGVVIDSGIYDKVRPFRAWNTRHPKTGLLKIRIELDALLVSSAASITGRAVEPIPFDPPIPCAVPFAAGRLECLRTRRPASPDRKAGTTDRTYGRQPERLDAATDRRAGERRGRRTTPASIQRSGEHG